MKKKNQDIIDIHSKYLLCTKFKALPPWILKMLVGQGGELRYELGSYFVAS